MSLGPSPSTTRGTHPLRLRELKSVSEIPWFPVTPSIQVREEVISRETKRMEAPFSSDRTAGGYQFDHTGRLLDARLPELTWFCTVLILDLTYSYPTQRPTETGGPYHSVVRVSTTDGKSKEHPSLLTPPTRRSLSFFVPDLCLSLPPPRPLPPYLLPSEKTEEGRFQSLPQQSFYGPQLGVS